MNDMTWINWHEWLEMKELKRMNWNEWIVMNEFQWNNWNEGIDMNELKRMNQHEGIVVKELKRSPLKEWIDMNDFKVNELTWVTWHEWLDMNDLSTSSWKSGPSPCEIELWLQSRAHFVAHFPDRAAKLRKHTPWSRTATLPEKNTGFCARECFQQWIHTFPIAHTSHLMMKWLTWWCGWHDDWDDVVAMMVRQLAIDNRP